MSAAQEYSARIDSRTKQYERLRGPSTGDRWGGRVSRRFRADPHRALDPNLAMIASYVQPDDTVVDVGGGAGRLCLPLALRCREVINVDSSEGMTQEFTDLSSESGITNARAVLADWSAADVRGDVSVSANVTYFVREIVPFIEKMEAIASRRVMITVWSTPPPNMDASLFRLVFGEDEVLAPGHRELLPVLWEMGILPDVRVLPAPWDEVLPLPAGATREEVITTAADRIWPNNADGARGPIEQNFEKLFGNTPDGWRALWRPPAREILITWESGQRA